MSVIKVEKLFFSYSLKQKPVLKGIGYTFEPGKLYIITGPNGSGKTTFLNCLNGSLKPDSGSVTIDGKNVRDFSQRELARNISLMPQDTNIDFDFTVKEIVLMGRYPYLKRFQEESQKDVEIARESMKNTGIFPLRGKYINRISGGERQRAILARAFAQDTPILLLDEPVSMLDIYYQVSIMNTVRKLMASKGITVIAILHDLNLAARYADNIILMSEGKIFAEGSPHKVYTPENIKRVYNIDVKVMLDSESNEIFIRPVLNSDI